MADAADLKPDSEQQSDPVVQEDNAETTAVESAAAAAVEASATEETTMETAAVAAAEPIAEAETAAAPEPSPAVAEPAEPEPALEVPTVASTIEVPASPQMQAPASDQEGGEWDLLVEKVRAWISSGQLQEQWQAARTPLSLLAGLIAVLLVLRVYSAVLGVLDSIPLLPGLLELAGLVAVVQFSLTRLVRSNDRRQVIEGVKQRWQSFRGRS
ncbi:CAAD domain-containing protein [Synechococcus sp. HK05]|uniref:CAAD domain-containing protein n=1 Tax=Synechococcus sp. HK05 TaxID=2725975 RepID=UPI001C391C8F|nr:CAAD domain-containing protein [Synechococcus sp. HK05]MBV2351657.1 CAAD domain-containing protein [Synechococcus sp. HK05]